jgi:hypothetical protein
MKKTKKFYKLKNLYNLKICLIINILQKNRKIYNKIIIKELILKINIYN